MTTITIKNAENLTQTEFENLDELRAYLSLEEPDQNESLETALGLSPERIGKLWDQGVGSGEPIPFDKQKEQSFLQDLEEKFTK